MANWTYEQIEGIASEGVSQGELAARIGLKYYEVVELFRDDAEFRRAFRIGQNSNPEIPLARKFAPEKEDFEREKEEENADEIREDLPLTPLGFRGLTNREKVLKAISEGNHLSRQICTATGLSIGEVTFEIEKIETAQDEKQSDVCLVIRREATFRAYFTPENAPGERDKIISVGGSVQINRFKEPEIPEEIWEAKRREAEERNKTKAPKPAPAPPKKSIEDLSPEDIELLKESVLIAIDENWRTVSGLQKHTGVSDLAQMLELLDEMVADRQIISENNGKTRAFFRYGQKPNSFSVMTGGRVAAEFDENIEISNFDKEIKEKRERANKNRQPKKEKTMRKKYTVEQFEECGRKGFNLTQTAKELGISSSNIGTTMASPPERREAYNRGLEMYKQQQNVQAATETSENSPEIEKAVASPVSKPEENCISTKTDYSKIPVTPEEDEAFEQIATAQNSAQAFLDEIIAPALHKSQDEEGVDEIIEKALDVATGKSDQFQSQSNEVFESVQLSKFKDCSKCGFAFESFSEWTICETCADSESEIKTQINIGNNDFFDHRPDAHEGFPENAGKFMVDSGEISRFYIEEIKSEPRFETLTQISTNGQSDKSIKLKQAEFLESLSKLKPSDLPEHFPQEFYAEPEQPKAENTKTILLKNGKINISFEGNYFDLSPEERAMLETLTNLSAERPAPYVRRLQTIAKEAGERRRTGKTIDRATYNNLVKILESFRASSTQKDVLFDMFVFYLNPSELGLSNDSIWDIVWDFGDEPDIKAEDCLNRFGLEIVD